MDLSPVLNRLATTLSSLLPDGVPPLCMYSTNDDLELDRLGRDVYCFFSSTVSLASLPESFERSAIRAARDLLQQAIAGERFTLVSFSLAYYVERPGLLESVGFRVYAKRTV